MQPFVLLAQPWWVNLLFLVPVAMFFAYRRKGLTIGAAPLFWAALFAAAFEFVEAAVVIYLRAATGLLPGYQGTLADVARHSASIYMQSRSLESFPRSLLTVEVYREAATMLMLISAAFLTAKSLRDRWAAFLWCFAIWDIAYYAGLWTTVRWPQSLTSPDVLFLIPQPWYSQVWFPILVSMLAVLAVIAGQRTGPAVRVSSRRSRARAAAR